MELISRIGSLDDSIGAKLQVIVPDGLNVLVLFTLLITPVYASSVVSHKLMLLIPGKITISKYAKTNMAARHQLNCNILKT